MRKLVIVLVMLMAAGMVFAATHATVSQSNDSAASVTITLPLASSDDYESIEVGFSSSEVTVNATGADGAIQASDLANVKPTAVTDTQYKLVDNNGTASLATGSDLYAYWIIKTKHNVGVSLYLDNPLTGAKRSGKINWEVSAGADKKAGSTTTGEGVYGKEHAVELSKTEANNTMKYAVGSQQLTIATEDYSEKDIDDYAANIVLAVSIGS